MTQSVVSLLRIAVRGGAEEDFARVFAELEVFEHSRRSGGFRRGRLLRPVHPEEPFVVEAEWEDAAAYERWLQNPVRAQLSARLEPLLEEDVTRGGLYSEVELGEARGR